MAALAVLSLAPAAHAQGVRYDNILLNAQGTPISGASVAVCTIAADTNTKPCAPLVQIYSDRALTVPLANPFLTAMGNYGFYAAPGTYLVQIYGGQLTTKVYTVTLPCDPAASSSCGTASGLSTTSAVSTGTLSVTGNISATGTVSSSAGTAPGVSGAITAGDCAKWASATSLADQGTACGGGNSASDAVQYVSPNGNDANPGLSWATAKLTIYSAWSAMLKNGTGGTVYLAAGSACGGPVSGQGLWIAGPGYAQDLEFTSNNTVKITAMSRTSNVVTVTLNAAPPSAYTLGASMAVWGASDASFNGSFTIASVGASSFTYSQTAANASVTAAQILPAGWLPQTSARVIGVGTNTHTANAPTPSVSVACGSSTQIGLALNGINTSIEFDSLSFSGVQGLFVANSSTLTFNDDSFSTNRGNSANGPAALLVGTPLGSSFWLYFTRDVFAAGGTATSGTTANKDEALVIDGSCTGGYTNSPCVSGGLGVGLVFIEDSIVNGGGDVKVSSFGTAGTFSVVVSGLTTEGQTDGHAGVYVVPAITAFDSLRIFDVQVADAIANTPAVSVPAGSVAEATLVSNSIGQDLNYIGPVTILSQYPHSLQNETSLPSKDHSIGFQGGTVYGQIDDARRQFGFVAPRFANLAPSLPASWNNTTGCFFSPCTLASVTAPDGTSNAGEMSTTNAGGQNAIYFYFQNIVSAAGDYWIAGAWVRSTAGNGYSGGTPLNTGFSGCTVTDISGSTGTSIFANSVTDGQWQWASAVYKVSVGGTCGTSFAGLYNSTHKTDFYGPVFIHIAAGTVSDNEAAEIGAHLGSYPDSLAPPVEATLRGHPIAFGGSGDNFFATLDHTALTANRTYTLPDAAGAIALSGVNGVSAGTVTLSGGSGSHTFGTAYSTAPTCTATDTTAANAVKATSSTTAVTLAGTGTDVVAWICTPAVN